MYFAKNVNEKWSSLLTCREREIFSNGRSEKSFNPQSIEYEKLFR